MTDAWTSLEMPYVCERMIGFSIPKDDATLVTSYEGTHLVRFGPPVIVETDPDSAEYDLYDPDDGTCRYQDKEWSIVGLHGGRSLVEGRDGERLELDATKRIVSVVKDGREVWLSSFENFSGDWAVATFSPDGRFIVLGCPYGFDFRVWKRRETALR